MKPPKDKMPPQPQMMDKPNTESMKKETNGKEMRKKNTTRADTKMFSRTSEQQS